jgi:hypothetical protein
MKNRKKYGARNTRNVKRNVGDKVIVLSNRSSGNTDRHNGYGKLKSQEAVARLEKVKDFIAQKSKFISASEFTGNGQTIEVLDYSNADGKYGPVLQVKFRDPKNNRERIWNISSVRAARAIEPFLEQGLGLIHVWTTGSGTNTMYHAKDASKVQKSKVKLNGRGSRRKRR